MLVRITVPVTDRKCPASLDRGMVSLVSSGHTGRPTIFKEQKNVVEHIGKYIT